MTSETASVPKAGDMLDLAVGEVVHGGWCVSRQDDTGWVIFVRHALPGELVRAVVTQSTARFARADAVEILRPSPDRVAAPCPYARPGGCGGCDWQHASLPAQRALKSAVISQQLSRIAGIDLPVEVCALAGDEEGLGWRIAVSFAVDRPGSAGLRKHRSHEVIEVDRCRIAHQLVTDMNITGMRWPAVSGVQVSVAPHSRERGVLVVSPRRLRADNLPPVQADSVLLAREHGARSPVHGRAYLTQHAVGRDWRVSVGGFWQVHPGAADALADAVLAALDPATGATAVDLYSGAGLFAGVLAEAVGSDGRVIAIEQNASAVRDARYNLSEWPWAHVLKGDAARALARADLRGASLVVLDPPRTGAAKPVIDVLCGRSELRKIAYVSCDPATLARDLRLLIDGGWRLDSVEGFDAFPMTHHVECLAVLGRE